MKRVKQLTLLLVFTLVIYTLLVMIPSYPHHWDKVAEGMTRESANHILKPAEWQTVKGAHLLEQRVGLRLWRIDLNFTEDIVSEKRIYYQDPHQTLANEVAYFLSEAGFY